MDKFANERIENMEKHYNGGSPMNRIYLLYEYGDKLVCVTTSVDTLKQVILYRINAGVLRYNDSMYSGTSHNNADRFSKDFDEKGIDYIEDRLDNFTQIDVFVDGEILR